VVPPAATTEAVDLARARADAAAALLGALLGVAVASDIVRGMGPGTSGGVIGEHLYFSVSPHPGTAAYVVGLALVLASLAAFALRRWLDARTGTLPSLVPFLPGALAPAVAGGGLASASLLFSGLVLGLAALAARAARARAPRGEPANPDLDLSLVAFALGAAAGLGLAAGRVHSPSVLLAVLAAAGALGASVAAALAAALARRSGASYVDARARAVLALLPLGLGVLAPWALGNSYEAPGWSDERHQGAVLFLAVAAPLLALVSAALVLSRAARPDPERDRRLLRRAFVFVVLPLAAASFSVQGLPLDLDLIHLGERANAAAAVHAGAVPFRDVFMIKPISDVVTPLAAFAIFGESVGGIVRLDALLAPLGAGAEALVAASVLPARLAGVVTAVRVAAPLRVLFGPYAGSLTPPHRFAVRDLALAAIVLALGAERPRTLALVGATLLAVAGCVGGFDATAQLLAALAVGAAARALTRGLAPGTALRGIGLPLALAAAAGLAALARAGALDGFVRFHLTWLPALKQEHGAAFDPPSAGTPLAIPLLALRVYGPSFFAFASLAFVLAHVAARRALGRGEIGALVVATATLVAAPVAMLRSDLAHLDAWSRLAPVLVAFTAASAASLLGGREDAAQRAAPWIGLAFVALGVNPPLGLEAVARDGLTDATGRVALTAPRGRGIPIDAATAAGCDAMLAAVDRRPEGNVFTFPAAPLVGFLTGRPSVSPFALNFFAHSPWERRTVAWRLAAAAHATVIVLPERPGIPEELRDPEVARVLWTRFTPAARVAGYLLLEPAPSGTAAALAPALDPAFAPFVGNGHDLGFVPQAWGREGLTTEVGNGERLAAFSATTGPPPATGPFATWSARAQGGALTVRGAPVAPDTIGFVRAVVEGEGRCVLVFTTDRAPGPSVQRSFGFVVSGPVSEVLLPVGAFAAWHWSGRIDGIMVRGDGAPVRVLALELRAPLDVTRPEGS
jgi:hypothetical protein